MDETERWSEEGRRGDGLCLSHLLSHSGRIEIKYVAQLNEATRHAEERSLYIYIHIYTYIDIYIYIYMYVYIYIYMYTCINMKNTYINKYVHV